MKSDGKYRANSRQKNTARLLWRYVSIQLILLFVYDVFHLPDGKIKLLRKWFITDSIKEPAFQDFPVSLAENPFINQMLKLAP